MSMDGGGSGLFIVSFYGGGLYLAVDIKRLMMELKDYEIEFYIIYKFLFADYNSCFFGFKIYVNSGKLAFCTQHISNPFLEEN